MNALDFAALDAIDYLSPLVASAPDLRPHFKHIWGRHQPSSLGHVVYSDWADANAADDPTGYYRETGFWTRDEAAILYYCAKQVSGVRGLWLDIGSYTGWTVAHAIAANGLVVAVDPLLKHRSFFDRFVENNPDSFGLASTWGRTSDEFFGGISTHLFSGVVIDGEHDWHQPLADAQNCAAFARDTGVILFHDFIGGPVREAVEWLISEGFKCRIYFTPHMIACCWRGDFTPPDHVPDPRIAGMLRDRCPDFDFERCV